MNQDSRTSTSSLTRSIAIGAIGFCVVSLCVFATVAYGEEWMYRTLGVVSAYVMWAVLFVVLSGVVFESLVVVRPRVPFYLLWAIAFLGYAAAWMLAYFVLGRTLGEFVGALFGSVLMGVVLAAGFGAFKATLKLSAVLFVANALGYFIGAALLDSYRSATGMLLFGAVYGLLFGAGIGAALHTVQQGSNASAT